MTSRTIIVYRDGKKQEQSSPSDHSAHGKHSNHAVPAEVLKLLKEHGVKLDGGNVDVDVDYTKDGGKRIRIRSGNSSAPQKKIQIKKSIKKGSSTDYPIVDKKALDLSIQKAFNDFTVKKGNHNIQVMVKGKDGEITDLKDFANRRHGAIVIDQAKGIVEGSDPRLAKIIEMDVDVIVQDDKKDSKNNRVIVQDLLDGSSKPMRVRLHQDHDGKKKVTDEKFEFKFSPENQGGKFRLVPKVETKDGVKHFRYEFKQDGESPKAKTKDSKKEIRYLKIDPKQVKNGVYDLKIDPKQIKDGVYRLKMDANNLIQGVYQLQMDPKKGGTYQLKMDSGNSGNAKEGVYRWKVDPKQN